MPFFFGIFTIFKKTSHTFPENPARTKKLRGGHSGKRTIPGTPDQAAGSRKAYRIKEVQHLHEIKRWDISQAVEDWFKGRRLATWQHTRLDRLTAGSDSPPMLKDKGGHEMNDFIKDIAENLKPLVSDDDLLELGIAKSKRTMANKRYLGTGPDFIRIPGCGIRYPRQAVIEWLEQSVYIRGRKGDAGRHGVPRQAAGAK